MSDRILPRERHAWIIAVAVLATSLAWLTVVDLALMIHAHGHGLPAAFVVARALFKSALLVVHLAAVAAPAAPALPFASTSFAAPLALSLGAAGMRMTHRSSAGKGARHA